MSEVITMQPGVVAHLPLDVIDFDPEQPRKDIDLVYIAEMAEDIGKRGVLQPITVRAGAENGRYVIKYGECRYRASRQAKKATIPALLDTEEEHGDLLSRLLDQVKENHLRRGLNPMEWAGVLLRMRNDHKIRSMAKIEDTLREHGITNMGRSYISNMMRLLELPEWAQDLIRDGKLTAAHGKYLLPACASEKVIEVMRVQLVDETRDVSVRQLQSNIYAAFCSHHQSLEGYRTEFDYKQECVKAGCQKMRKVGTENYVGTTFCLDRACFDEKNAAAEERKAAGSDDENYEFVPPIVAEDNSVDCEQQEAVEWQPLIRAPFDTTPCHACEHCHVAVHNNYKGEEQRENACFEPASNGCWDAKRNAHFAAVKRIEQMDGVLKNWLLAQLSSRIEGNTDAQLAIIALAALEDPYSSRHFTYRLREAQGHARKTSGLDDINAILDGMNDLANGIIPHSGTIAVSLLQAATMPLLLQLAQGSKYQLAVDIADYRIDADFLEYLDGDQLLQLTLDNARLWPNSSAADLRDTIGNLDNAEIIEILLTHADLIKTPAEIQAAWDRMKAKCEGERQETADELAESDSDDAAA